MSLKIEFIDGPLVGRVFTFPETQEVVEIGRDPDHCQVVLPPDFTGVGRRHLVIRQTGGRYRLETHPNNPVLVDDREPLDGEPLGRSQVVTLGRNAVQIRITTSFASALPDTDVGKPQQTLSERMARQRRMVTLLAALIVVVAAGLGWFYLVQDGNQRRVAALLQRMEGMQQATVTPDVLKKVSASVYLVLVSNSQGEESTVGTAWVFDGAHLATNAHVAEAFKELQPGQKLIARGTMAPYNAVDIESIVQHPDYTAFDEEWLRTAPSRIRAEGNIVSVNAPGAGYDVALMKVAAGSQLAPPLSVANRSGLRELSAGSAVAFAGFPMEALAGGGVNPKAPVPQTQVGHVTALSDYFLLPSQDDERLLIQHSIPVTGGASGSPMVDAEGRVVGLISGMNIIGIESGRAPNAAGINFAQRADLLAELTAPPLPDRVAGRRQAWERGFASFDDPSAAIPRQLQTMWVSELETTATPVALPPREAVMERDEEDGRLFHYFGDVFKEPGHYLILAMSKSRHDIDMVVSRGDEVLAEDGAYDWYPSAMVTLQEGEGAETELVVYMEHDPSQNAAEEDLSFTLLVWHVPL